MANIREIAKFLAVGSLNTVIGLSSIYSLMFFFGFGPLVSNFLGYVAGIAIGYCLNRGWTFNERQPAESSFVLYFLVAAGAYIVNISLVFWIVHLKFDPYLAQLAGIAAYTILAYLGNVFLVFKRT